MVEQIQRREFLKRVGAQAAAGLGCALAVQAAHAERAATTRPAGVGGLTIRDLPKRKLGRTGVEVPPLAIGLAGMGHAFFTAEEFEPVVHAAIDAGVTYLDIAPNYDVAQERLGPIMAKRRKEVFLVGKTEDPTRDGTLRLIEKSLRQMQTDYLDVCHLHNVGQFTTEQALGKGGMLEGIQAAKDRKLVRFIGASGHQGVGRFVPVLETGQIDVLMVAMNFVDRHTYNFEERILPLARRHGAGIVAMKVLGGVRDGWGGYRQRKDGVLSGEPYHRAIRYVMGLPGLCTVVLGIKSLKELSTAIAAVRGYKPFTAEEAAAIEKEGKTLAARWRDHFGPVGWDAA